MTQWLARGTKLNNTIVKRLLLEDYGWQLYLSSAESYILVISKELFDLWRDNYALPDGFFHKCEIGSGMFCCASAGYLISSIEKGPFPSAAGEVEAFAVAYKKFTDSYGNVDLSTGIYIEEYSMLLPGIHHNNSADNAYTYGKWITGGVNVSVNSLEKVEKLMAWLPKEFVCKTIQEAGFDPKYETDDSSIEKNNNEISIPNERFELPGRPELEDFFNDNIIDIIRHQKEYKKMGISFPGATILYGAPGCGKTYAVDQLIQYLGWKRFDIDSASVGSSLIHDTSKKLADIFEIAIESAPSVIVIDEMEAFLSARNATSQEYHIEEMAEFLRRIPEAASKGVLIFAMTNLIERIDPAVLRKGRFDYKIEVKQAGKEEIECLLEKRFKELPIDDDVSIDTIAEKLSNHPMSDIAFVIREAGMYAVKNKKDRIDLKCFLKAFDMLPQQTEKAKIGFQTTDNNEE